MGLPSELSKFHLALHSSSTAVPADHQSPHQRDKWMVHSHMLGELLPGKASKSTNVILFGMIFVI